MLHETDSLHVKILNWTFVNAVICYDFDVFYFVVIKIELLLNGIIIR